MGILLQPAGLMQSNTSSSHLFQGGQSYPYQYTDALCAQGMLHMQWQELKQQNGQGKQEKHTENLLFVNSVPVLTSQSGACSVFHSDWCWQKMLAMW